MLTPEQELHIRKVVDDRLHRGNLDGLLRVLFAAVVLVPAAYFGIDAMVREGVRRGAEQSHAQVARAWSGALDTLVAKSADAVTRAEAAQRDAGDAVRRSSERTRVAEAAARRAHAATEGQAQAIRDALGQGDAGALTRALAATDAVQRASRDAASLPIGSVVAFPGPATLLDPSGAWRLCDGSAIAESECAPRLREVLGDQYGDAADGALRLPDYRGLFLRGQDPDGLRDPGGAARAVGSTQPAATAMPVAGFSIDAGGEHSHALLGATRAGSDVVHFSYEHSDGGPDHSARTDGAGDHDHALSGGDVETRPINVTVHWLIRVR